MPNPLICWVASLRGHRYRALSNPQPENLNNRFFEWPETGIESGTASNQRRYWTTSPERRWYMTTNEIFGRSLAEKSM